MLEHDPICWTVCFAPLEMVSSSFCSLSQFSSIIRSPLHTPGNCQDIDDASTKLQRRAAPGLSRCIRLDQPSSYYGAVFPQRDLRGKELPDKLDLAVRGFTVNESSAPQGTAGCRYFQLEEKNWHIFCSCRGPVTLHLSCHTAAGI